MEPIGMHPKAISQSMATGIPVEMFRPRQLMQFTLPRAHHLNQTGHRNAQADLEPACSGSC